MRGLLAALSDRLPLETHALPALNTPQALAALLWRRAVRRDLPVRIYCWAPAIAPISPARRPPCPWRTGRGVDETQSAPPLF